MERAASTSGKSITGIRATYAPILFRGMPYVFQQVDDERQKTQDC